MVDLTADWAARKNLINERKADWLTTNSAQLKLIQYVITRAYDEYQESDDSGAADVFIDTCDDAIRSLISIVVDLRHQDFTKPTDSIR